MDQKFIITKEKWKQGTGPSREYLLAALFEDRRMVDIFLQPAEDGNEEILNHIYVGRVKNIVKNLNAAFVEITKDQVCYLSLEDLKNPIFTKKQSKTKPISEGDELLVQVSKEAVKTKAPVLTTNLSFAGEYLVLTTGIQSIGVSSKLAKEKRQRLLELAKSMLGDCAGYGMIVRTNADAAPKERILQEYKELSSQTNRLLSTAASRTRYSCLYSGPAFYYKAWQDLPKQEGLEIVTDEPDIYQRLAENLPKTAALRFYDDPMLSLAKLYNIAGQIEDALKERIWLKSGANLIIQPTEALTVIDVNSGKNTAKKEKRLNHYRINVEAAEEIAHQLRLRNISGIIIIDFIDMEDEQMNESLLSELRGFLKPDPVPVQVIDMTRLGLVEATRKKVRRSLREVLGV